MNSEVSYLKSICAVFRAFGSTLDRKELLDLIVDTAAETMGVKGARLFLITRSGESS